MAEIRDYVNNPDPQTTQRWPEGMAMSAVNDTSRIDEGIVSRWEKDINTSLVSTGSGTAYVLTPNRDLVTGQATPLYEGLMLGFTAHVENGADPTLNVQATGAKQIIDDRGNNIGAGTLKANSKAILVYSANYDGYILTSIQEIANLLTTRGAMLARGETDPVQIAPGANAGAMPYFDGTDTKFSEQASAPSDGNALAWVSGAPTWAPAVTIAVAPSEISKNAARVLDVAAKAFVAEDDRSLINLPASTVNFDATGNGGRLDGDTLTADTWYHILAGRNTADGAFVVGAKKTLAKPAAWDNFRRLGSIRTNASSDITDFTQDGDEFLWNSPRTPWNVTGQTGGVAVVQSVDTPPDVKTRAMLSVECIRASGSGNIAGMVSSLDQNDTAASSTPDARADNNSIRGQSFKIVRTNTSSQIRQRVDYSAGGASDSWRGFLWGWIDPRGRDG